MKIRGLARTGSVMLTVSAVLFAGVINSNSINPANAASKITTYKLLWCDEFTGKKGSLPNPKTWDYDLGGLNQNGELQFYTKSPKNISLNGS